jgi:hypothetical protein
MRTRTPECGFWSHLPSDPLTIIWPLKSFCFYLWKNGAWDGCPCLPPTSQFWGTVSCMTSMEMLWKWHPSKIKGYCQQTLSKYLGGVVLGAWERNRRKLYRCTQPHCIFLAACEKSYAFFSGMFTLQITYLVKAKYKWWKTPSLLPLSRCLKGTTCLLTSL